MQRSSSALWWCAKIGPIDEHDDDDSDDDEDDSDDSDDSDDDEDDSDDDEDDDDSSGLDPLGARGFEILAPALKKNNSGALQRT